MVAFAAALPSVSEDTPSVAATSRARVVRMVRCLDDCSSVRGAVGIV